MNSVGIFLKDSKNSIWIMIFLNRLRWLWETIYITSKTISLIFLVSCSNEEYYIEGSLTLNTNTRTFDKEPTISKEASYQENICTPNEGTNNCLLLDKNTGNIFSLLLCRIRTWKIIIFLFFIQGLHSISEKFSNSRAFS